MTDWLTERYRGIEASRRRQRDEQQRRWNNAVSRKPPAAPAAPGNATVEIAQLADIASKLLPLAQAAQAFQQVRRPKPKPPATQRRAGVAESGQQVNLFDPNGREGRAVVQKGRPGA